MMDALQEPFFLRALLAGLLAAVACGIVGTLIVVRQIASISGGLSHAAFGGVGLGYLLRFDPLLGAALFSLGCGLGIGAAYRHQRTGLDTLIAMVWSIGMALGMVFIALSPGYAPDLMSYLFGSILFVPTSFIAIAAGLDVVVVVATVLLYRRLQAITFDEEFAAVLGVPVGPLFYGLLAVIALTVVVLIRIVGVILAIALLTIPAATARQWSDDLRVVMLIAIGIGALCTTAGLFLSYGLSARLEMNMPTGPLIILVAATVYGLSVIASRLRHGREKV
ncbi:MAG: metal ABC transporter permease [Phycisphaerales bacterium]|nr:metal ABC transporter permease [Phycisphaerae bacterium]NNF43485.1 metal ABC transporter permease [Phycisphaerales bacterium]NNM26892.1 metal ABC transporter permease [Phycisphaerales bacterium]